MKFSVFIPSRGRVRQLAAAITSLHKLESGENQITYGVACDVDDIPTKLFCQGLQAEISLAYMVGERPESLGNLSNQLSELMPADVYCIFGDDLLCLTPNWDREIVRAVEKTPHGVFWWQDAFQVSALVPVITEKWRAAAGRIFTDYFPFWYDDIWLIELWCMATDQDPIFLDIVCADRPQATQRMRDLAFWQSFVNHSRAWRVEEAKLIAKKLRLPVPMIGEELSKRLTEILSNAPKEMFDEIEKRNVVDRGEPGPAYLKAKARVEALMRTH